ncbi:MAG: hypothetical protein H7145_04725 [Akkermansiaceae bacterium]|nr:hypothetical protein [Armatimonadota bacterium]
MRKTYGSLRLWLWTLTPILCVTSCQLLGLTRAEFAEAFGAGVTRNVYDFVLFAGYGGPFFVPMSFLPWIIMRRIEGETTKPTVLSLQKTIFTLGMIFAVINVLGEVFSCRAR